MKAVEIVNIFIIIYFQIIIFLSLKIRRKSGWKNHETTKSIGLTTSKIMIAEFLLLLKIRGSLVIFPSLVLLNVVNFY